jgi:hypothetical protein
MPFELFNWKKKDQGTEKPVVKREITNEAIKNANEQGRKVTAEELGLDKNLTEEEQDNLDLNNK